jgi:hypothetical protein
MPLSDYDLRHYYNGPPDWKLVSRARRAAQRLGWRVVKSRNRYQDYNNRGLLMLVDENNIVVDGEKFDLTPEQVIVRCAVQQPDERR